MGSSRGAVVLRKAAAFTWESQTTAYPAFSDHKFSHPCGVSPYSPPSGFWGGTPRQVQSPVPDLPKELVKVARVLPKRGKPACKRRAAWFTKDARPPLLSVSGESAQQCYVFGGQFGDHVRMCNAHTFQPIPALARNLPPRLILVFVFKTHTRTGRNVYAALFAITKE